MRSERSKLGRWVGFTLAAATIIGGGLAVVACSNGGEGDACNYLAENNGDDDCQDGLICWQAKTLNGAGTDLCCPPDRAQATTAACAIPATAPGVDAAIPADTGSETDGADAATSDAPADETSTSDGATVDGATGSDGAADDGADGGG